MLVVPVIDLFNGIVVHAVKGNRKEYRAISSTLSSSPKPLNVISDLLKVFNFKSIYIADLNALEHQSNNISVIDSIIAKFPNLEIWLDTGFSLIDHYLNNYDACNIRLILSSESLPSATAFTSLIKDNSQHNFILSLDYKADELLGPDELLQNIDAWPRDIIVLNLNNVGAEFGFELPTGLDHTKLSKIFNIFYGGGIRDLNDIKNLKSSGFFGALVSTALHKKSIKHDDLISLNQSP